MNIFLVNVLLTFLWGFVFLVIVGKKTGKRLFCIFASAQWILISGLRGMTVAEDMVAYEKKFNEALKSGWKDIFDNFYFVYIEGEGKDPGYDVFEKIVQLFTDNYHVFIFIVAVLFFGAMGFWIYKNSEMPMMSFIIFDSFLYSFFALTGTRQTLATVVIVFLGDKLIKEKKFVGFLILAVVAYTIHKSAICYFPFFFISMIPVKKRTIAGVLVISPLLFMFKEQFFEIIGKMVGYEYDELESTGAYLFTAMYLVIFVVSIILLGHIKKNCDNYKLYYNALFMGLLLIPLIFVNPAAMRAVQYYSLYIMLLVPEIIRSFEKKIAAPIYVIMMSALLIATNAFVRTDYTFFWQ